MLIGTPIDLRRLIDLDKPALRVTYRLQEVGEPTLADVLAEHGLIEPAGAAVATGCVTLVVALGGNALVRAGERGTAAEQLAALRDTFAALAPLVREGDVVVTHGNGPQVGNELLRQERAADEAPPLPLWLAVAQTQAEIGALIESELAPSPADRSPACSPTSWSMQTTRRSSGRRSRSAPSTAATRREALERERGWAGRGGRRPRVAARRPVPRPARDRRARLDPRARRQRRQSPVACGGGGIPVTRRDGKLKGIDAVIDKDRASALLARQLAAERLLILTEVPAVYRAFGTESPEELRELTVDEAEGLLPELPRARCGRRSRLRSSSRAPAARR